MNSHYTRLPWILAGVVLVLFLYSWGSFNGIVASHENVDAKWAQVETQYQRRFDLIPNIVSTVKGAANFEQSTFTAITQARSSWTNASTDRTQKIAAAQTLDTSLSRLIVAVEAYPQLQATKAFQDLMTVTEGTENRIATARKDYNDAVQTYNVSVKQFPRNLFARLFGYGPETFFQNTEGSETAPVIDFGTSSQAAIQ